MYTVKLYLTEFVVASGTRDECIQFIKGFDDNCPVYVDLRLFNDRNVEENWHAVEDLNAKIVSSVKVRLKRAK